MSEMGLVLTAVAWEMARAQADEFPERAEEMLERMSSNAMLAFSNIKGARHPWGFFFNSKKWGRSVYGTGLDKMSAVDDAMRLIRIGRIEPYLNLEADIDAYEAGQP